MDSSPDSWQETFTQDFPGGLVMRWEGDDITRYAIPQVEVVSVIDDQPVVRLDVFGAHKSFICQVSGYTVVRCDPTLARVVARNYDLLMIWDADLPDHLADAMRDYADW